MQIRIGQGIDVHKLTHGRKLILGGIEIPYPLGLEGHSDADVLTHSIIDALLGAMSMGDIGGMFPDTDSKWKNADSLEMLKVVIKKMKTAGYRLINLDSTVMTEEPKLKPYISDIKDKLAKVFSVESSDCSIKAGTMEKLGFVGRKEGIVAQSVVLIARD